VLASVDQDDRDHLAVLLVEFRIVVHGQLEYSDLQVRIDFEDDGLGLVAQMTTGPPDQRDPGLLSALHQGNLLSDTVPDMTDGADSPTGHAVRPDRTAAAFFDVDNTLMRGASIFHLARGLYRRKFFSVADLTGMAWKQAKFALNGENLDDVAKAQADALTFIRGHRVDEMRAVGEEVWHEIMADKIWPGTHALAKMHLEAGQQVWLVTATPQEIADVIAERLELTGALGTLSEHIDGVYTGFLVGQRMHGSVKADAVRSLAEREGFDLARCSAYSDSANDLPLLTLVGRPCAINPDAILRAHAKANGWPIRDYRTARKAAKASVPFVAAAGAIAGAVMGASAIRRRRDN
jgi:HAD superfamily hydrolase (TIGR01490 family)